MWIDSFAVDLDRCRSADIDNIIAVVPIDRDVRGVEPAGVVRTDLVEPGQDLSAIGFVADNKDLGCTGEYGYGCCHQNHTSKILLPIAPARINIADRNQRPARPR